MEQNNIIGSQKSKKKLQNRREDYFNNLDNDKKVIEKVDSISK